MEYIKNTLDSTVTKIDTLADKFDKRMVDYDKSRESLVVRIVQLESTVKILWFVIAGAIGVILSTAWQVWVRGVFKL